MCCPAHSRLLLHPYSSWCFSSLRQRLPLPVRMGTLWVNKASLDPGLASNQDRGSHCQHMFWERARLAPEWRQPLPEHPSLCTLSEESEASCRVETSPWGFPPIHTHDGTEPAQFCGTNPLCPNPGSNQGTHTGRNEPSLELQPKALTPQPHIRPRWRMASPRVKFNSLRAPAAVP